MAPGGGAAAEQRRMASGEFACGSDECGALWRLPAPTSQRSRRGDPSRPRDGLIQGLCTQAGLLSKHKQAEELLRPLEQQVQRIKRLRHGESAEPPSRSTETPPKTTGKSESEDSARGGSAKEATRAYSAPEEVPAGRHRPASSGEPGIGRSSDAHSSSDPWVQECSISPEEWRVAIRVPTAKAASEVRKDSHDVIRCYSPAPQGHHHLPIEDSTVTAGWGL